MDFPKRLLVVDGRADPLRVEPTWEVAETLPGLPVELLPDGVEVAIYRLTRVKRLEVSRRLVKMDASDPDDGEGDETAPNPEQPASPA